MIFKHEESDIIGIKLKEEYSIDLIDMHGNEIMRFYNISGSGYPNIGKYTELSYLSP